MVLFSAAWTWGMATPARADAAAILPVFLMNSRREVRESWVWFIGDIFLTLSDDCQFKKFSPRRRGARVRSRMVAADVRRRILARRTLPPSRRASVSASLRRDRAEARGEGGKAPLRRDGGGHSRGPVVVPRCAGIHSARSLTTDRCCGINSALLLSLRVAFKKSEMRTFRLRPLTTNNPQPAKLQHFPLHQRQ